MKNIELRFFVEPYFTNIPTLQYRVSTYCTHNGKRYGEWVNVPTVWDGEE
jgi:hypothetical protein